MEKKTLEIGGKVLSKVTGNEYEIVNCTKDILGNDIFECKDVRKTHSLVNRYYGRGEIVLA